MEKGCIAEVKSFFPYKMLDWGRCQIGATLSQGLILVEYYLTERSRDRRQLVFLSAVVFFVCKKSGEIKGAHTQIG
jgi:hypothetical protein